VVTNDVHRLRQFIGDWAERRCNPGAAVLIFQHTS
jgi:hypothetical protein